MPVASIAVDNVEAGRLQGSQFAALLPGGGTVLYLEGPAVDVSKQRHAGTLETLPPNIELQSARGRWTAESGAQALQIRLGLRGTKLPDLVGSQNDEMAMGARNAVEALPAGPQRDQWLSIPYTGVDGVPATGQAWVQKQLLAATIIMPPLAGLAIELLAKAALSGQPMPEHTMVPPTSYPPDRPAAARGRRRARRRASASAAFRPSRRKSTKSSGSPAARTPAIGRVDVVVDAHELHADVPASELEPHVAGAPVAVLRAPHAARVHEVDAVHHAVPRLVRVAEGDHVARLQRDASPPSSGRSRPSGPPSSRRC